MSYITADDIKNEDSLFDKDKYNTEIDYWVTQADSKLESHSEYFDISPDNIKTPIHYEIKEWLVAWCLMKLCKRYTGLNNQENSPIDGFDKYDHKLEIYQEKEIQYRERITADMIGGTRPLGKKSRVTSFEMRRG